MAGNVANANTPGYRALDVQPFSTFLDASPIALASTNANHITPADADPQLAQGSRRGAGEESLSGNTVNLERQMINLGDVNRDFTMTANIRRAFHQLLLTAIK